MRLLQRFKRLPGEEPHERGEIPLPTYPLQTMMEIKSDSKSVSASDPKLDNANTAHNTSTYNIGQYTISHPMTLVERVEHEEKRRYGTSFFGKFYDIFVDIADGATA